MTEIVTQNTDELFNTEAEGNEHDLGEIFAANLHSDAEPNERKLCESNDINKFYFLTNSGAHFKVNWKEVSGPSNAPQINKMAKKFPCRLCDKILKTKNRLSAHLQSHHNASKETNCKHCNRQFNSFERLLKHLRRCILNNKKRCYNRRHPHRPTENFICDICGRTFKLFHSLLDHMNERHSKAFSFKCRICDKVYPSRYYLSKHLSRHKQVFENGGSGTIDGGDLDADLVMRKTYVRSHPHRPQSNFVCDICGKSISQFGMLQEHMSSFHGAGDSFQCRYCGQSYPNRYYLNKHKERHKKSMENGNEEISKDLDKDLIERKKYKRHLNESEVNCDECGRVFKHYYLLLEHKSSQHMGESMFECRKCGRHYPNRYFLTKHLKRHEEAEAKGVPLDADLDEGLMERSRYIRSDPKQDKSSFDCEICGIKYTKFCYLTEHMRSKHWQNSYQCRKCLRCYPSRYYLQKHVKRHGVHSKENDKVVLLSSDDENGDDCDVNLMERRPYVRNHPHHPKSEFTCDTCGIVYKRYELLQEHMTSNHSGKECFKCNICNRTYPNRYYLQKHLKRHKEKRNEKGEENLDEDLIERSKYFKAHPHRPTSNFCCDICNKTLSTYYSIKEHMISKHSIQTKQKRSCSKCDKTFVSKKRLEKHFLLKHPSVSDDSQVKTKAEMKHMCSICGRLFPDRSKMLMHEKTHFGFVTSCEICGKKLKNKNYLRKHIRSVHAQERPFSCNIDGCEWKFAYSQCLKRHQARRHGMVTNRNACPICSKEFPDSTYHLKRHLKAHANNTAKEYIPESKS